MTAWPEISLIIPTHNRARLLLQTIEAALKQTVPFGEIIVVDDASTDDTLVRLRQFGARIKVIESIKIGVQAARNMGVEMAKSPYVTLCDSDDLLNPVFVETIACWLASHNEIDSVYVNYQSFDESGTANDIMSGAPAGFLQGAQTEGKFVFDIPDLYAKTDKFQPMLSSGITVKKSFYQGIGGFNPAFDRVPAEDWEYTLRAVAAGRTAMCLVPLALIRRHAGNDSGNLLRLSLGEVDVLKYVLKHHAAARPYRKIFLAGICRRYNEVFYESFRKGQFSIAGSVFPLLQKTPDTIRFRIKKMIMLAYTRFDRRDYHTVLNFSQPKEHKNF